METLAYIHLALADELPTDAGICEGVNWRKFSSQALFYLLPVIAVTLGILGMANDVLAQQASPGDRNVNVTQIQERLREKGYFNQEPTGFFGPITERAVRNFQGVYGLGVDGIVGSETEALLFQPLGQLPPSSIPPIPNIGNKPPDSYNSRTVLRIGDRGEDVKQLQRELRRNGFDPGPIDGIYGERTESAVWRFERANGLVPDGVADRQTLQALGILEPDEKRYVAIVPGDYNTLVQVKQYISGASWNEDRRGSYVNAGAFGNRDEAESRSHLLRVLGFDARVEYF